MINDSFHYQAGSLWGDGVALDTIAEAVGTPAYVYSATRLLNNVHRLQTAFAPLSPDIHYSIKANGNLALLRLLKDAGLGMDAVSAGEIYRAQQAGVDPAHIVYAGVGKTRTEIAYALAAGVGWFNVESHAELQLLNTLAGETGQTAQVALRLNPGIQAQTHHHIATGHFGAKFGMTPDIIQDILAHRADYAHLHIAGLHIHIGSQLGDVRETVEAVRAAQALAAPYADMRTLNIGGGFPVHYTASDEYPPPEAFATALVPALDGWQLMIEPGRSIVADAGMLLVSVLYIKEQGGQRFVISDGSMTELIRPALYDAIHPVIPVRVSDQAANHEAKPAIVVGPVCESSDVLHRGALLPPLVAGDRLAVMVAGAYGMVMASNYNMRPRPPEVLVEGDTWRVIRRRETWQDVLQFEM
ncbi:MAG: diaminopimelate decarboxylase [Anaerolineae bacterium]|nr:diaminopimelate decarboxylase [Anaerolineae bacterium]